MKRTMHRRAFSLVELLVAVSIVVLLMALLGGAVSSSRTRGAKDKTRALITALDAILQRHFTSCESVAIDAASVDADRGAAIRRKITADMPDSWEEVRYMKLNSAEFNSPRQRSYVATLNAVNPTDVLADAECLFMIVMQGGLTDCLTCASLDGARTGDWDGDGAPEFWDAWNEPIHYVLWPAGFEYPIGVKYFDQEAPFGNDPISVASPGGKVRPLVFSGGPSKKSTTDIPSGSFSNLAMANSWFPLSGAGTADEELLRQHGGLFIAAGEDFRADNITNYDAEVK